jgi:hypothetical protein
VLVLCGMVAAVLVITSTSSAYNVYACVKKSGAARISKKKLKCRKGEKKLSWSSRGKTGASGTNGTNGTNGAKGEEGPAGLAAGFGATQSSGLNLLKKTELTVVPGLSKAALPVGSYIASANVEIDAKFTGVGGQTAGATCELIDTGAATAGKGRWQANGVSLASEASGVISLNLAVTTTTTSTLSLQCKETSETGTETLSAVNGSLVAVQTKSIS